jgi:citrate lyase beta subunit
MTLTLGAERPDPHVHLDNRALFVSDGARTVMLSLAQTRWLVETLDILAQEGRATRSQQQHVFGGFRAADGAVVLYAGAQEDLVAVRLSGADFDELRTTLGAR